MVDPWAPLGAALLAYHRGRHRATITVISDHFETEKVPVKNYYRPEEKPLPELEIRALAACRGRVLDLGAGAGRHALELQRRGHEVVALDVSPDAVDVMRSRGVEDARVGDQSILGDEPFDTILLLMNGIGLAGTLKGLDRLLADLRTRLADGGRILFDSADLGRAFDPTAMKSLVGQRMSAGDIGEVTFKLKFGRLEGAPYRWLFVDPPRMEKASRRHGFRCDIPARGARGSYLARLSRENLP